MISSFPIGEFAINSYLIMLTLFQTVCVQVEINAVDLLTNIMHCKE